MNWEAFLVIGLLSLVLGLLIYIPAKLWIKRKVQAEPDKHSKVRLTKMGWMVFWLTIFILIVGYSMQYIIPDSMFGQFVKTPVGRLLFTVGVAFFFWVMEVTLKSKGFNLINKE